MRSYCAGLNGSLYGAHRSRPAIILKIQTSRDMDAWRIYNAYADITAMTLEKCFAVRGSILRLVVRDMHAKMTARITDVRAATPTAKYPLFVKV
jgi:hypothetical protein